MHEHQDTALEVIADALRTPYYSKNHMTTADEIRYERAQNVLDALTEAGYVVVGAVPTALTVAEALLHKEAVHGEFDPPEVEY